MNQKKPIVPMQGQQMESSERSNQDAGTGSDVPVLEWVVAIMGLILVSGSIGFLFYQAITRNSLPPDIILNTSSIIKISNGYLIKFKAMNKGDSTAKGLIVEGRLKDGSEDIEISETTLDYLPSHSEREGGLFFTKDPRQFELQLRAVGYEQP